MNVLAKPSSAHVVKSADRALDLLEFLAAAPAAPTFTEIAGALAIPKSSLSQLIANLVAREYISFDDDRAVYRLGPRINVLARRAAADVPFEPILLGAMEKLRDQINESVTFYRPRGDLAEVVAAVASRHPLVYTLTKGESTPLYAMSAGKIFLSYMSQAELTAYLKRVEFVRYTPRTIHSKSVLRKEIDVVRRNGIAFANEELTLGIRGMAVPILAGKHLIGALNVAIPVVRCGNKVEANIRMKLQSAAHELTIALGQYDSAKIARVIQPDLPP